MTTVDDNLTERVAISCTEAAKNLGLHYRTVRRLALNGEIPSFMVGGSLRIGVQALHEFIEQAQAERATKAQARAEEEVGKEALHGARSALRCAT